MLWQKDRHERLKNLLLSFLIKSQFEFRDMESYEISLADMIISINNFCDTYFESNFEKRDIFLEPQYRNETENQDEHIPEK